jgi:GDP-D-mannose dehydratase
MLVRFDCPACHTSHSFDMPETTISMTCSRTHKVLEVRLTQGGDVRTRILNGSGEAPGGGEAEE